ncbi:MAG: GTP-binding protein, partial [Chloroflexi bacterium]|nr:GTP-binding protein [Chloroflexota bacterium]
MYVIGTAGHVDHGKSTLVRALTGIDPDRLKEEKARGMTIDLGFAWIDLATRKAPAPLLGASNSAQLTKRNPPSTLNAPGRPVDSAINSVGVIDVPGHIDFIKNMLAGVGGIDAALLVIAADEGVMPQTREHLAILDLLAVPAGVVALTKIDLIDDPEWLDLVELDVAELLQETQFATAPIVRVSAVTGAGLDQLRHALALTLGRLAPRRNRARPRLPVDRIFSLSGFGTVVTGTLSDGSLAVGDAVELLPSGHTARIRGLQTHKQAIEQGQPGSRLAINLGGVSTDEIHRGDVVVKPGTVHTTQLIDVQCRLLADAPRAIEHNQSVDFFSGAAEIPATIRLLGTERLEPGQTGWLQLVLARPTVVVSGDRYILRQPSPSATLGGGVILSPHPRRRWRRFDPAVLDRFQTLAKGAPDEILLQTLIRRPLLTAPELLAQSELDLESAQEALTELRALGVITVLEMGGEAVLLTSENWEQFLVRLRELLTNFHRQQPLRQGMPRSEARNRLQSGLSGLDLSVRLFNAVINQAVLVNVVQADDSYVWLATFHVTLTLHQQAMVDDLLATLAQAAFTPPSAADLLRLLGGDTELLEMLVEQQQLVRISDGLLFRRSD